MGIKFSKTVSKPPATSDEIYKIRESLYQTNLRRALVHIDKTLRKEGYTSWWFNYDNKTGGFDIWQSWRDRFHSDVKNDLERRGFSNVVVKQDDGYTSRFLCRCDCTPPPEYKTSIA